MVARSDRSPAARTTPVLFLVFNRPDLTKRVFARIRAARPARLFIAADGPRADRPGEARLCEQTRRVVADVDWPCEVQRLYRDGNLGAKKAVGSALTWFFEHVESGIILEDDCLPDPSFFPFCAELLERYRDDERVLSISGDCFQPDGFDPGASYYFSQYQHIWGWATWRRAWRHYEPEPEKNPCLFDLEWLTRYLEDETAAQYWKKMLTCYVEGRFDSWGYPWMASCWVRNGLCLLPARNLVTNIGFDPRGTHTQKRDAAEANLPAYAMSFPLRHPAEVVRIAEADRFFTRAFLCPDPGQAPPPRRSLSDRVAIAVRRGLGLAARPGKAALATPVLFLVFNRPDLAKRVFARIRAARPTRLFVAADGPRVDRPGEAGLCEQTRRVVADVDWPCEVQRLYRDGNLGAKKAVGSALTWFFEHVESGIILEDDCLPDPSFFPFCAELLERYRDDERVLSISGDCFQPDGFDPEASYYFSQYQHIWGWATWRRAWRHYEPELEKNPCLFDLEWLTRHLGDEKAAQYWKKMLTYCVAGRFDAWDYPWMGSCWLRNGLCLLPARNLVTNIGFDPRATHTHNRIAPEANRPVYALSFPLRHPGDVVRNEEADRAFLRTFLRPDPGQAPAPRRGFVQHVAGLVRRARGWRSAEQREERRLRRLPGHEATETTLLGRRVRIVDAPSFLAGRHEILNRSIYDFEAGRRDPLIIDCGANIGLSVIYFKERYPAARVMAFEADPQIFQVLAHNIAAFEYAGVALHQAAVWVQDGELSFCAEGGLSGRLPKGEGDAARQVRVPARRLRDVLAQGPVDLLKLDIEGAEAQVLADCREYVRKDRIRHLFLEYHSHAQEPQVLHELLAMLAAGGYRYHLLPAYVRKHPFVDRAVLAGMDLQLNVYAY